MKQTHRGIVVAVAAALLFASTAAAAGPVVSWSVKDMKTAIRGLAYPKAHAKKLTCLGQGTTTDGRFPSFRCTATYTHHRRARFAIQGQGLGGWLCAGKTLSGCKLLRHGFVTSSQVALYGSTAGAAELAARGFMENKYAVATTVVTTPCAQTGTLAWSCGYAINNTNVTVTVTLKAANGGYVITGSSS